jgi:hypothetical protein
LAQLNQTPSDEINGVLYRPSKPAATPPPPRRSSGWLTAAAVVVIILGAAMTGYWQLRERFSSKATPAPVPVVSSDPLPPIGPAAGATVQTISVAKQGEADTRTIAEALVQARPGTLIRVLDDAVYDESIGLDQGDRQAGIQLVSEAGATLVPPPAGAFALLAIKNTPRVTVRGFKIRPAAGGHGVVILGICPGARLEACDVAAENAEHWALIFVTEKAAGSAREPIVIQDCIVRAPSLGLVIQGEETDWAVAHVRVTNCRFSGSGQHVQLNRAVQDVALVGNLFIRGSAVICSLGVVPPPSDSLLTNNTFFESDCWLDLAQSRWESSRLQVRNNLIVGVKRLQLGIPSLAESADNWSFSHNVWEPAAESDATQVAAVARSESGLPFVSRDPAQVDFLRPRADSPAANAGAGGTLPSYAGAIAPVPSSK